MTPADEKKWRKKKKANVKKLNKKKEYPSTVGHQFTNDYKKQITKKIKEALKENHNDDEYLLNEGEIINAPKEWHLKVNFN
jgi:hypothetical protein